MESLDIRNRKLMEKYPVIREWIRNLPVEQLNLCRPVEYERGDIIFRRGWEIRYVYLVLRGSVIISSSNINGNEMCVVFVQEGSTVGEMEAMLNIHNLIYSAKAFTACALLEVPLHVFRNWIRSDRIISEKLAMVLAEKLYRASASTVQYQYMSADRRLKMLLAQHGQGRISDTREELAEACGVSVRTINRAVTALKEEGLIMVERGKIVMQQEQLEQLTANILEEV